VATSPGAVAATEGSVVSIEAMAATIVHAPHEQVWSTMRDVIAGTLGGTVGVLLDHPFDTIKVRLQAASTAAAVASVDGLSPGASRAPPAGIGGAAVREVVALVRHEGPRSLYKGMLAPIAAYGPTYAIAFGAYGNAMRFIDNHGILAPKPVAARRKAGAKGGAEGAHGDGARHGEPLMPYDRVALAGAWAGLLSTGIVTPMELVKCRMQVQRAVAGRDAAYLSPFAVARRSLATHGVARGLYRGWLLTTARDIPSVAGFFVSYEWTKATLLRWRPPARDVGDDGHHVTPAWVLLAAGAVSGPVSWAVAYPIDTVKSVIQTAPDGAAPKAWTVARQGFARGGVRFFVNGLGTAVVGAIPATALCVLVYEYALAGMHGSAALDH